MQNKTGTRLSAALLGYMILVILLLTLNPFYIALPTHIAFTTQSDLYNFVSNILLFLPLGFFYRLTTGKRGAFLLGAVTSSIVETAQIFIPARTPSTIDILANTLGAGLGAWIHAVIATRFAITRGTVGQLQLETPLMGLVYLLIPLLWADALTLDNSPNRWILTALIGLCGAILLSEIFRHWWERVNLQIGAYAAIAAGTWFLIGSGPAYKQPFLALSIGLAVICFTVMLTLLPRSSSERRFERATLRWVIPLFGLYLFLLALWYPLRPLTAWHATLGFTNRISETSLQVLYPRIEYLMASTILGYLLAEWRGRSEIPLTRDLPRLFLYSFGIALSIELLAGFQRGPGASLIRVVMVVFSALFGGSIYHFLRAHIRFLLGR